MGLISGIKSFFSCNPIDQKKYSNNLYFITLMYMLSIFVPLIIGNFIEINDVTIRIFVLIFIISSIITFICLIHNSSKRFYDIFRNKGKSYLYMTLANLGILSLIFIGKTNILGIVLMILLNMFLMIEDSDLLDKIQNDGNEEQTDEN